MYAHSVKVPNRKWYGEGNLDLTFPTGWEVMPCCMNGHSKPELSERDIRDALDHPSGRPPLRELASGKSHIAILFNDISRPTPVSTILKHVLDELREAGIQDTSIRLVCAGGCHGAHSYMDFERKLGSHILDRFPVYNHNVYENCTHVGTTSQGTKLYVNSEVMACDLKIGIGSVITHPQTGFGGGGKIILPGVSAIESIQHYHELEFKARDGGRGNTVGMSNYRENPMAKDFQEAAGLAGLDFKIDVLINGEGKACALFCGDVQSEYYLAAEAATAHYATRPVPDTDVAVVNTYSKGNEAFIGLIIGITMLIPKGGDLVLIMDCPGGQVVHYLIGSFGKHIKGRQFQPINFSLPWVKRVIILCPQFEHSMADWLAIPGTRWVKTWAEVLEILKQDYPDGARAAVVPDGTIQYLATGV